VTPRPSSRLTSLALAALPGAVGGWLGLLLVLFLLPEPLALSRLPLAWASWGSLGAALALGLQLPGLRSPATQRGRLLPWLLAALFAVAAGALAAQVSLFGYHLPAWTNRRMLKAAAWLAAVAVVLFYTALLHALQRRRYGWRSRIGLSLGVAVALIAAYDRYLAQPPAARADPVAPIVTAQSPTSLLWVDVPGLSLDVLLPLAEGEDLPLFARAIRQGAYGRLEAVGGVSPLAGQAALATGTLPWRSGVRSGLRFSPPRLLGLPGIDLLPFGLGADGGRHPIPPLGQGRRQPLLWEIAGAAGLGGGAVGWPAADGEGGPGPEVSVPAGAFAGGAPTVPPDLADRIGLFAPAPAEVDAALRRALGAEASLVLSAAVRGDGWRLALAGALARERALPLVAIHLPGFAEVAATSFGGFAASRLGGSRNREAVAAGHQLATYLRWFDGALEAIWRTLPPPRVLAVTASHSITQRPFAEGLGLLRGRPLVSGRLSLASDGVLVLFGDDVAAGTYLAGARVVDVAPTLLYGLGLPAARDFDGRVLTAAFEERRLAASPLSFVESYRGLAPPAPR
jgi:hypothetical protein